MNFKSFFWITRTIFSRNRSPFMTFSEYLNLTMHMFLGTWLTSKYTVSILKKHDLKSHKTIMKCSAKCSNKSIKKCIQNSIAYTSLIWKMLLHSFWIYLPCHTRGWSPKYATRLNIIIGIVQKVKEWPSCSFAKMMYS